MCIKNFNLSKIIILLCCFLLSLRTFSQQEDTVLVQIKILELGVQNFTRNIDAVFKFHLSSMDGEILNSNGTCYEFKAKDPLTVVRLPNVEPKFLGWQNLKPLKIPILSKPELTIFMEAYADYRGEVCVFDKKDEHQSFGKKIINLYSLTPGDLSDTVHITDNQENHFWAKLELKYTLIPPDKIKSSETLQPINSSNKKLQLNSGYKLPNKEKLNFNWEYSRDNGSSWRRLEGTKSNPLSLEILPYKDIFEERHSSTEQLLFRLKVNSRDTTGVSELFAASFTPPPPSISAEQVVTEGTCKGYDNGKFTVGGIRGYSNKIAYILKRNSPIRTTCNFQNPSAANCPGFIKTGEISGGKVTLENLPPGSYTILFFNSGIDVGEVYESLDFEIKSYPDLNIDNLIVRNPSCKDENGGIIQFDVEGGGNIEIWQLDLAPYKGKGLERNGNRITFASLPADNYTLEVTDGCSSLKREFSLKLPDPIVIESIKGQKNQNKFSIVVNVQNGSGRYMAIISTSGGFVKQHDSMVNNIIPLEGPNTYQLRIVDKVDPDCLIADSTFIVDKDGFIRPITKTVPKKTAKMGVKNQRNKISEFLRSKLLNLDKAKFEIANIHRNYIYHVEAY